MTKFIFDAKVNALTENALDAFWEVVAQRYPEARSGDLSIDRTFRLSTVAYEAIQEWIENNVNPPAEF